MNAAVSEGSD